MEKRRFSRLPKCLPLEYSCRLPGSGEISSGKGISQNISLSGIYLKCENSQLRLGQLIDLTITEIINQPIGYTTRKFKVAGRVVRLEPSPNNFAHLGMAVKFLAPTDLSGLVGQDYSRDEPRMKQVCH